MSHRNPHTISLVLYSASVSALVLVLGLAAVVFARSEQRDDDGACSVIDSPCTLEEIVEQALIAVPGIVLKAGFTVRHIDDEKMTLYKVKILDENGQTQVLFFDTNTCEQTISLEPTVSFLDALDIGLEAAEEAAPGPGSAIALTGVLKTGFEPIYRFKVVDPQQQLVTVIVDAITGDPDVEDPKAKKKKKKKKKKGKGAFRCNDADSDSDVDSDSDSDSDGDTDSD